MPRPRPRPPAPLERAALRLAGMGGGGPSPRRVRDAVDGRTVIVTGASRGIGAEVALRLGACGAQVVLIARDRDALAGVAARITRGGRGASQVLPLDLRDTDAAHEAGERVVAEHGAPAVLISNAGHSVRRSLAATTDRFHDVQRLTGVNFLGAVALALPILAAMRAAGSGHLVAVSSASALVPAPGWSSYGASKAAHDAWVRAIRAELRGDGVTTTSIYLPLVHTAMSAPTYAGTPGMSVADAADWVGRAVVNRPRTIAPWWVRLAGHVALAAPGAVDRLAPRP